MARQAPQGSADDAYELLAVTGRFQPFHLDHLELVTYGLGVARRLVIGITNPDARSLAPIATSPHRHRASANPLSYLERLRLVVAALDSEQVPRARYDVVPFPLEDPAVWSAYVPRTATQMVRVFSDWERDKAERLRAGGYRVLVLDGERRTRISASAIRAAMATGEAWQHWVPAGARELLSAIQSGHSA